jgi:HlyD family secretion protein
MRKLIFLLLLAAAGGGAFYYSKYVHAEQAPNFRTAEAERGDLLLTISATGTLEPEEVVDVGAQVMGRIKQFGPDLRGQTDPAFKDKTVDYNTQVKEGQLLAKIDPALYQATYDQAKAGHERAKADLAQAVAKEAQTKAEYDRAIRLSEVKLSSVLGSAPRTAGKLPSPTTVKGISNADFILAKANWEVAAANVKVCEAAVNQQKAIFDSADTNLKYTTINSPVDGTIIARRVNIGQTVVASLNAPSLFLIAMDLRKMEIWSAVNEADIGRIRVGMPVGFEVDAFPGETFRGKVSEIRLDAEMQNHVVVYRVLVATENNDLKLLPYLSAHVKFEIDNRKDALLVPNAALRYTPRPELVMAAPGPKAATPEATATGEQQPTEVRTADSESSADKDAAKDASKVDSKEIQADSRRVWVRHGNSVYPLDVQIGVTDGALTEILGGDLQPGMQVVLGEDRTEVVTEGTNPLAPPRFRGKKKAGK